MNKSIIVSSGGRNSQMAGLLVNRLLPDEQISKVGPFVLLDHLYPTVLTSQHPGLHLGQNAHPHRGIASLSYVLSGSLQHLDSHHHHGEVGAGGLHWLKAGNGIVHDEGLSAESQCQEDLYHSLHFWINLPAEVKMEEPEYRFLPSTVVVETVLPDYAGIIRILLGSCGDFTSPIRTFLNEFIYHVRLNPKSTFRIQTKPDREHAVFIPTDEVQVNGKTVGRSHLLVLSKDRLDIELYNPGIIIADAFIFGGSEYKEPIVVEGPFVMNTRTEIAIAYRDFFENKYGEIKINPPW